MDYEPYPAVSYNPADVTSTALYCFALPTLDSDFPPGCFETQLTITEHYSDGSRQIMSYQGWQGVPNWTQSPYGLGPNWSFDDLDYVLVTSGRRQRGPRPGRWPDGLFFLEHGGLHRGIRPYASMTLTGSPSWGFTLTGHDGVRETFNGQGQLLTSTDNDGNTTACTYNYYSGQLTWITDGSHHTTWFGYSGDYLTTIYDFAGRVTTLGYDSSGRLTSDRRAGPSQRRVRQRLADHLLRYDATSGLLTFMINADGNTTTYHYSSACALTSIHYQGGGTEYPMRSAQDSGAGAGPGSLPPLAASVYATYTDPSGVVTTIAMDSLGLPLSVTQNADHAQGQISVVTAYVRNSQGLVTEMSQPDPATGQQSLSNSPVTTYQYDDDGNLTQETSAMGPWRRGPTRRSTVVRWNCLPPTLSSTATPTSPSMRRSTVTTQAAISSVAARSPLGRTIRATTFNQVHVYHPGERPPPGPVRTGAHGNRSGWVRDDYAYNSDGTLAETTYDNYDGLIWATTAPFSTPTTAPTT